MGENKSKQAARYIAPERPAAMLWLFAQEVAFGEPPLAAYRMAFERFLEKETPPPDEAEVRKRAKRTMGTKSFRKFYHQFLDDLRAIHRITPEQWMSKMASLREGAVTSGDMKAAVRAHELIGKALNFFVERHIHAHVDMTRDEAVNELGRLAKEHPKIFQSLMAPEDLDDGIIEAEIVESKQEPEHVII